MSYAYQRRYVGCIKALICDWAGTIVDFGSLAPILALCRLFKENGVPITDTEARVAMGVEKWIHIHELCELPSVHERWVAKHGRAANEADIDHLYAQFLPMQLESIAQCTTLINGFVALTVQLRRQGIKIGTNTGYSREMVKPLLSAAAEQGFTPDSTVCATEVPKGRPYPFMCYKNMMEMEIESVSACVKVDDTVPGIEEGLNAGMWTVAVVVTGNEIGMSHENWLALPEEERKVQAEHARARLMKSGAHYVIDSIADIGPVIEEINAHLNAGQKP